MRRRNRLKGKKVTQEKQSHFIDLGEGTHEKGPAQQDIEAIPPREESPFQLERENSPPLQEFEFRPRQKPEVDSTQKEAYNYLESLERSVVGPSTTLPLDAQV